MGKALNLEGQRFGNLVAVKRAPSRSGKTYWLCQCDCGNQKEIQTGHLTSGVTKSCGCSRIENLNNHLNHSESKCILCGKTFVKNVDKRLYCYECSPSGLSAADRIRFIKRNIKHRLIMYKGGKCSRCGYDKCEAALQFHHLNPDEKEFTLSKINLNDSNFTFETLLKEADKCILLCANCHAEEHYTDE